MVNNLVPIMVYNPQEKPVHITPDTVVELLVAVDTVDNKPTQNSSVFMRKTETQQVHLPAYLEDMYKINGESLSDS